MIEERSTDWGLSNISDIVVPTEPRSSTGPSGGSGSSLHHHDGRSNNPSIALLHQPYPLTSEAEELFIRSQSCDTVEARTQAFSEYLSQECNARVSVVEKTFNDRTAQLRRALRSAQVLALGNSSNSSTSKTVNSLNDSQHHLSKYRDPQVVTNSPGIESQDSFLDVVLQMSSAYLEPENEAFVSPFVEGIESYLDDLPIFMGMHLPQKPIESLMEFLGKLSLIYPNQSIPCRRLRCELALRCGSLEKVVQIVRKELMSAAATSSQPLTISPRLAKVASVQLLDHSFSYSMVSGCCPQAARTASLPHNINSNLRCHKASGNSWKVGSKGNLSTLAERGLLRTRLNFTGNKTYSENAIGQPFWTFDENVAGSETVMFLLNRSKTTLTLPSISSAGPVHVVTVTFMDHTLKNKLSFVDIFLSGYNNPNVMPVGGKKTVLISTFENTLRIVIFVEQSTRAHGSCFLTSVTVPREGALSKLTHELTSENCMPLTRCTREAKMDQRKAFFCLKNSPISAGRFNLKAKLNAFTIEMWVLPTNCNEQQVVFSHGEKDSEEIFIGFSPTDSGLLWKAGNRTPRSGQVCATFEALGKSSFAKKWTHICAVYTGAQWLLYYDGKQVATAEDKLPSTAPIKKSTCSIGHSFSGCLLELRVWKYARSPEYIMRDMYRRLNGDELGLEALFPMDEGQHKILTDLSPAAAHGIIPCTDYETRWLPINEYPLKHAHTMESTPFHSIGAATSFNAKKASSGISQHSSSSTPACSIIPDCVPLLELSKSASTTSTLLLAANHNSVVIMTSTATANVYQLFRYSVDDESSFGNSILATTAINPVDKKETLMELDTMYCCLRSKRKNLLLSQTEITLPAEFSLCSIAFDNERNCVVGVGVAAGVNELRVWVLLRLHDKLMQNHFQLLHKSHIRALNQHESTSITVDCLIPILADQAKSFIASTCADFYDGSASEVVDSNLPLALANGNGTTIDALIDLAYHLLKRIEREEKNANQAGKEGSISLHRVSFSSAIDLLCANVKWMQQIRIASAGTSVKPMTTSIFSDPPFANCSMLLNNNDDKEDMELSNSTSSSDKVVSILRTIISNSTDSSMMPLVDQLLQTFLEELFTEQGTIQVVINLCGKVRSPREDILFRAGVAQLSSLRKMNEVLRPSRETALAKALINEASFAFSKTLRAPEEHATTAPAPAPAPAPTTPLPPTGERPINPRVTVEYGTPNSTTTTSPQAINTPFSQLEEEESEVIVAIQVWQEVLFANAIEHPEDNAIGELTCKYSESLLLVCEKLIQKTLAVVRQKVEKNRMTTVVNALLRSFVGACMPSFAVALPLLKTSMLITLTNAIYSVKDSIRTLAETVNAVVPTVWLVDLANAFAYLCCKAGCCLVVSADISQSKDAATFHDQLFRGGQQKQGTQRDVCIKNLLQDVGQISKVFAEVQKDSKVTAAQFQRGTPLYDIERAIFAGFCNAICPTHVLVAPTKERLADIFTHVASLRSWILSVRQEDPTALDKLREKALMLCKFEPCSPAALQPLPAAKQRPTTTQRGESTKRWRKMFHGWKAMRRLQSMLAVLSSGGHSLNEAEAATVVKNFLQATNVDPSGIEKTLQLRSEVGSQRLAGLLMLKKLIEEMKAEKTTSLSIQSIVSKTFAGKHFLDGLEGCASEVSARIRGAFFGLMEAIIKALTEASTTRLRRHWAELACAMLSVTWQAGDFNKCLILNPCKHLLSMTSIMSVSRGTMVKRVLSALNHELPESQATSVVDAEKCSVNLSVGPSGLSIRGLSGRGCCMGSVPWINNSKKHSVFYFEVTIVELPLHTGTVAVGIGPENFNLSRPPGWEAESIALHSDDGTLFVESSSGRQACAPFRVGDTIGCGLDVAVQELFWTRNGKLTFVKASSVTWNCYPLIGMDSKGLLSVNFGGAPFLYQLEMERMSVAMHRRRLCDRAWDTLQAYVMRTAVCCRKTLDSTAATNNPVPAPSELSPAAVAGTPNTGVNNSSLQHQAPSIEKTREETKRAVAQALEEIAAEICNCYTAGLITPESSGAKVHVETAGDDKKEKLHPDAIFQIKALAGLVSLLIRALGSCAKQFQESLLPVFAEIVHVFIKFSSVSPSVTPIGPEVVAKAAIASNHQQNHQFQCTLLQIIVEHIAVVDHEELSKILTQSLKRHGLLKKKRAKTANEKDHTLSPALSSRNPSVGRTSKERTPESKPRKREDTPPTIDLEPIEQQEKGHLHEIADHEDEDTSSEKVGLLEFLMMVASQGIGSIWDPLTPLFKDNVSSIWTQNVSWVAFRALSGIIRDTSDDIKGPRQTLHNMLVHRLTPIPLPTDQGHGKKAKDKEYNTLQFPIQPSAITALSIIGGLGNFPLPGAHAIVKFEKNIVTREECELLSYDLVSGIAEILLKRGNKMIRKLVSINQIDLPSQSPLPLDELGKQEREIVVNLAKVALAPGKQFSYRVFENACFVSRLLRTLLSMNLVDKSSVSTLLPCLLSHCNLPSHTSFEKLRDEELVGFGLLSLMPGTSIRSGEFHIRSATTPEESPARRRHSTTSVSNGEGNEGEENGSSGNVEDDAHLRMAQELSMRGFSLEMCMIALDETHYDRASALRLLTEHHDDLINAIQREAEGEEEEEDSNNSDEEEDEQIGGSGDDDDSQGNEEVEEDDENSFEHNTVGGESVNFYEGLSFRGGNIKVTTASMIGPLFTIDFWIRPRALQSNQIIIQQVCRSGSMLVIRIFESKIYYGWTENIDSTTGMCEVFIADTDPQRWTRITCVQDCSELILYKNGTLRDNVTSVLAEGLLSSELVIGATIDLVNNTLDADVRDIRFFDVALKEEVVESMFSVSLAPTNSASGPNLVLHLKLCEGQFPLENAVLGANGIAATIVEEGTLSWIAGERVEAAETPVLTEIDFGEERNLFTVGVPGDQVSDRHAVWKTMERLSSEELLSRLNSIEHDLMGHYISKLVLLMIVSEGSESEDEKDNEKDTSNSEMEQEVNKTGNSTTPQQKKLNSANHTKKKSSIELPPGWEMEFCDVVQFVVESGDDELVLLLSKAIRKICGTEKNRSYVRDTISQLLDLSSSPQNTLVYESPHPCKAMTETPREVHFPQRTEYEIFFDQRCSTSHTYITFYADHSLSHVITRCSGASLHPLRIRASRFYFDVRIDGSAQWGYKMTIAHGHKKQNHAAQLLHAIVDEVWKNPNVPQLHEELTESHVLQNFVESVSVNTSQCRRLLVSCLTRLLSRPTRFLHLKQGGNILSKGKAHELRKIAEKQYRREVSLTMHSRFVSLMTEFLMVIADAEQVWDAMKRIEGQDEHSFVQELAREASNFSVGEGMMTHHSSFGGSALNVTNNSLENQSKIEEERFAAIRNEQKSMYTKKFRKGKDRVALEKRNYAEYLRVETGGDRSVACWSEYAGATVAGSVALYGGKWYFEVKILSPGDISIGVCSSKYSNEATAFASSPKTPHIWCYNGKKSLINLEGEIVTAQQDEMRSRPWQTKDVVGVVIDIDEKKCKYYLNGVEIGVAIPFGSSRSEDEDHATAAAQSSMGPRQPSAIGISDRSIGYQPVISFAADEGVVVNFGASHFDYPIPRGCLPIDPANLSLGSLLPFNAIRSFVDCGIALLFQEPFPPFYKEETDPFDDRTQRIGPPHLSVSTACDNVDVQLLEVKNNGRSFATVVANCSVIGGKWHYEVTILSQGLMQIGWATPDFDMVHNANRGIGVGDTPDSWSVDLYRRQRWMAGHAVPLSAARRWAVGDVIGCSIDVENRFMSFSVNGKTVADVVCGENFIRAGAKGFVAAASFRCGNGCIFNFGSTPLKYKPDGYCALGVPDSWNERVDTFYSTLHPETCINRMLSADRLLNQVIPITTVAQADLANLVIAIDEICVSKNKTLVQFDFDSELEAICKRFPSFQSKPKESLFESFEMLKCFNKIVMSVVHLIPLPSFVAPVGDDERRQSAAGEAKSILGNILVSCTPFLFHWVRSTVTTQVLRETNVRFEHVRLTVNRMKAKILAPDTPSSTSTATIAKIAIQDTIFGQTHQLIVAQSPRIFRTNQRFWSVVFSGEGAEDVGGPFRDHLSEISSELMSSTLPLFVRTANNTHNVGEYRDAFVPSPSAKSKHELSMFELLGRIMGGAYRSAEPLNLFFPPLVWKFLVGKPLEEHDLEHVDHMCLQCVNQFRDMKSQGIDPEDFDDAFYTETFTTQLSDGTMVELVPGGASVNVTYYKCEEYATKVVETRLNESASQLSAMRAGLMSVVPDIVLCMLKAEELEVAVCGKPDYTVDELKESTIYESISSDDRRVGFLWAALESASSEQRKQFLKFVSGRERMPVRLRILPMVATGDPDQLLPRAATCFFALELPDYTCVEVLKEKLFFTIANCIEIDTDFRARDVEVSEEPNIVLGVDDIRAEEDPEQ